MGACKSWWLLMAVKIKYYTSALSEKVNHLPASNFGNFA